MGLPHRKLKIYLGRYDVFVSGTLALDVESDDEDADDDSLDEEEDDDAVLAPDFPLSVL